MFLFYAGHAGHGEPVTEGSSFLGGSGNWSNGILLEHQVGRFVADAEAIYS
jgi:hypothetical protein